MTPSTLLSVFSILADLLPDGVVVERDGTIRAASTTGRLALTSASADASSRSTSSRAASRSATSTAMGVASRP